MDPLGDVLRRLLEQTPDVPAGMRDALVRAGGEGHDALRQLFERQAAEALRASREHQRALESLIRRP